MTTRQMGNGNGPNTTALIEPARGGLLSQQVADWIERSIAEQDLRPGDRLPSERELTARYHVSRTAVRAAIALLEQRGLIAVRPGSGAFVWDGSSAALGGVFSQMLRRDSISPRELMEARFVLEVHNAGAAAMRATPVDLASLGDILRRGEAARRPQEFVEAAFSFHIAVARAGGNRLLVALLESVRPLLLHGMLVGAASPEERAASNQDHAAVLAAIAARDLPLARRLMGEHLRHGLDVWVSRGVLGPDESDDAQAMAPA